MAHCATATIATTTMQKLLVVRPSLFLNTLKVNPLLLRHKSLQKYVHYFSGQALTSLPNKKNSFDVENNVRKTINFHLDVDEKYWILLFFKIV